MHGRASFIPHVDCRDAPQPWDTIPGVSRVKTLLHASQRTMVEIRRIRLRAPGFGVRTFCRLPQNTTS